MSDYSYIFAPLAENNVREISDYLARSLLSPQAAKNFLDKLDKKIEQICQMPTAYRLCAYSPLAKIGIRFAMIKKYKAYFEIDEQNKTVYFLFVRHSSQSEENLV